MGVPCDVKNHIGGHSAPCGVSLVAGASPLPAPLVFEKYILLICAMSLNEWGDEVPQFLLAGMLLFLILFFCSYLSCLTGDVPAGICAANAGR